MSLSEILILICSAAAVILLTAAFIRGVQINTGWPDPYWRRLDVRAEIQRLCEEQDERERMNALERELG